MTQRKTIVVTGASAGIGAGIARRLGADGHQLVLAARRPQELQTVAADAELAGAERAIAVQTDVTDRAEVEALRDAAISAFGGFDVWINNAGRGITRSVLELSDRDVDEMMNVNVKTALYGMQIAAEHFLERGHGHIINISSFLGRVPMATHRSAYNAAKAALNALTANLRVELRAKNPNILVTLVMPGMVATDFAQQRDRRAAWHDVVCRIARADRRAGCRHRRGRDRESRRRGVYESRVGRHGASLLRRRGRVRGSPPEIPGSRRRRPTS